MSFTLSYLPVQNYSLNFALALNYPPFHLNGQEESAASLKIKHKKSLIHCRLCRSVTVVPKLDSGAVVTFGRKRGRHVGGEPSGSAWVWSYAGAACAGYGLCSIILHIVSTGVSRLHTGFFFPPAAKQVAHFSVRKKKGWQCENPKPLV